MIGSEDAPYTFEYDGYFKILPTIHSWATDPQRINGGKSVPEGFTYTSDNNTEWMTVADLKVWIDHNRTSIGRI